jgi:hypothetical protein
MLSWVADVLLDIAIEVQRAVRSGQVSAAPVAFFSSTRPSTSRGVVPMSAAENIKFASE